jgi:hypothetical protein
LRHVSFDSVNLAETLKVRPPAWAVPIVEAAGQTPLILAGEDGRQRVIWIAFDTLESNWPLRISFPIFLANAVDWLNPAARHASQWTVRAGEAFRFGLNESVTNAQVTFPDGQTRELSISPEASELVFADTRRQGVYRLELGTNQMPFCVNLMDSTESDITPKPDLSLGEYAQVEGGNLRRANMELWRWIALAGLAVLLFEWWYYHKRTV